MRHATLLFTTLLLGFSAAQPGLPDTEEVDALRVVLGDAGEHMLTHAALHIMPGDSKAITFMMDSGFRVATAEVATVYSSLFSATQACSETRATLASPAGTRIAIGRVRLGWAKEGPVHPTPNDMSASYAPAQALASLGGEAASGSWTLTYRNDGNGPCQIPGAALRLTELKEESTRLRNSFAQTAGPLQSHVGVVRILKRGDRLQLHLPHSFAQGAVILRNASGRTVARAVGGSNAGARDAGMVWDLPVLKPGRYFLHASSQRATASKGEATGATTRPLAIP